MIIAGTGHTTPELTKTNIDKVFLKMVEYAKVLLENYKPEKVISGMAIGWDQALAIAAYELGIPFIACCPFVGQESIWPKHAQEMFHQLLKDAAEVVIVCEGGYEPWKMQARNEWMVKRCDLLMALWNGNPGGTKNTVDYAEKVGKEMVNVWPGWTVFGAEPAPMFSDDTGFSFG